MIGTFDQFHDKPISDQGQIRGHFYGSPHEVNKNQGRKASLGSSFLET
jgi:hypothetical protein